MSESYNVTRSGCIVTQITKENHSLLSSSTPSLAALDILSVDKISNCSFDIV